MILRGALDWKSKEVVNIHDELSLWSAPFARIMLGNIPMKAGSKVLDIGFGTGFPLVELSQRFGNNSTVYGIDPWSEAVKRTREKIRVLGLTNVRIFEQSAETIPLPDNEIDLICSNLGVNNFENKEVVLKECYRVLNENGSMCITTNPVGTFKELFDLFREIMTEMKLMESISILENYIDHRGTEKSITKEFENIGFRFFKKVKDNTSVRFVNSENLLDYGLFRIGFLDGWKKLVPEDLQSKFFDSLVKKIEKVINTKRVFEISIPILFLEFKK